MDLHPKAKIVRLGLQASATATLELLTGQVVRASCVTLSTTDEDTSLLAAGGVNGSTLTAQLFTSAVFGSGTLAIDGAVFGTEAVAILAGGQADEACFTAFGFDGVTTLGCVVIGASLRSRTTNATTLNCSTLSVSFFTVGVTSTGLGADTVTTLKTQTALAGSTFALATTFETLHADTFGGTGLEQNTNVVGFTSTGSIVLVCVGVAATTRLILLQFTSGGTDTTAGIAQRGAGGTCCTARSFGVTAGHTVTVLDIVGEANTDVVLVLTDFLLGSITLAESLDGSTFDTSTSLLVTDEGSVTVTDFDGFGVVVGLVTGIAFFAHDRSSTLLVFGGAVQRGPFAGLTTDLLFDTTGFACFGFFTSQFPRLLLARPHR